MLRSSSFGCGVAGDRAGRGSVEDFLHEGEHVGGAEDDSEGGCGGPASAHAGKGAGEYEELSDEAVEHGQADHGKAGDDEERGQHGLASFWRGRRRWLIWLVPKRS